jgi:methylmalonyl-CoA mutase N-terminal domain/subunit
MLLAVARRRGIPFEKLGGTIQNDVLKEYVARGTYIYPPEPSMRLVTDVMSYCAREVPQWNTISISGYHIREAGSTALEEIAFTLSNGKAYLRAARDAGIDLDTIAPRLSFFWNAHNDLFEEVAKFRAARYLWAHITRDEFGCKDPRSHMLRFHTQTAGSTLTAQEPENNVIRVTLQALAAVLGGTQSLHTNGRDEALALPTAESAKVALRTQQIIGYESGEQTVVGVNKFVERGSETARIPLQRIDDAVAHDQITRLHAFKNNRDAHAVEARLAAVRTAARGSDNLMPFFIDAVDAGATLGEVCNVLRDVFGVYRAPEVVA